MVNRDLVKYFEEGLERGISVSQLKSNLLKEGWDENEVNRAMSKVVPSQSLGLHLKISSKIFLITFLVFLLLASIILLIVLSDSDVNVSQDDWVSGKSFDLVRKPVKLEFSGEEIVITPDKTFENYTKIRVNSKSYSLNVSEEKEIDSDNDGSVDLLIRLEEIKARIPRLYVKEIISNESGEVVIENTVVVNNSVQNQTEVVCVENWSCSNWGECSDSEEVRTCQDLNKCGTIENRPSLARVCEVEEVVNETEEILETVDCGILNLTSEQIDNSSIDCMRLYSGDCEPAKVTYYLESNFFGIRSLSESIFEIIGLDGDNCTLNIINVNATYWYSEELINESLSNNQTLEEIEQSENELNQLSQELFPVTIECSSNSEGVDLFLDLLENGVNNFTTSCEGSECSTNYDYAQFDCVVI